MASDKDGIFNLQGRYNHEGAWNSFSGSMVVRADGIIVGENLFDDDGTSRRFNIDGFLVSWKIPVMIFLKRYPDGSDFYYQIHKKDNSNRLEGEWEGNWAASVSGEARILLYEVLLGYKSINQIEEDLQSGGSNQPFIRMRDVMTGQTLRKTQEGGWTVQIVLSSSD